MVNYPQQKDLFPIFIFDLDNFLIKPLAPSDISAIVTAHRHIRMNKKIDNNPTELRSNMVHQDQNKLHHKPLRLV